MEIFVIILLIVFILSVTLGFTYNDKVAKSVLKFKNIHLSLYVLFAYVV